MIITMTNSGGMLSAASMHGGMLSAVGAQQHGGKLDWGKALNVSKKVAGIASPFAMLGGPQMLPVSAGLAAFAGSGKKKKAGVSKKQGKKIKKDVDLAAQIGSIIAESQGYTKEADAMQRVGKVVAHRGGGSWGKLAAAAGAPPPPPARAVRGIASMIGKGKKTKKVKNTIGDHPL